MSRNPLHPQLARRAARRVADRQEGVIGRRQLYAAGVPRWLVRAELAARRWQRTGRQSVALHNGPLTMSARRWIACLEAGPRAALDGATALQAAGLDGLTDPAVHVIVPKGWRRVRVPGARVHESRRWREDDVVAPGIRRVRPATAAVHAALWARTDREATYLLVLVVQQGLARPAEVHDALVLVRRHARRRLLLRVVTDLAGGARSLGELDVARAFRRRGLPEPERQAVRRRPSGTQYLDADFDAYQLTLEIDGVQHDLPYQRLADLLRDLTLVGEGRTVVRIPLVAWRLDEEAVLDGLEALFSARGWVRPAA